MVKLFFESGGTNVSVHSLVVGSAVKLDWQLAMTELFCYLCFCVTFASIGCLPTNETQYFARHEGTIFHPFIFSSVQPLFFHPKCFIPSSFHPYNPYFFIPKFHPFIPSSRTGVQHIQILGNMRGWIHQWVCNMFATCEVGSVDSISGSCNMFATCEVGFISGFATCQWIQGWILC